MLTFNDILTFSGVEPAEVKILRHGTDDPRTYDAWRNDRERFEGYQSRQDRSEIPDKGYVASFVVNRAGKNIFAGLYRIGASTVAPDGDVDPLTGHISGDGKRRIYELARVGGWEQYEGRLVIDWPTGNAGRLWHRNVTSRLWLVLEIADQHDRWPGWRAFHCDADALATLPSNWRDLLTHTKGVYVLMDLDDHGKLYVGSA